MEKKKFILLYSVFSPLSSLLFFFLLFSFRFSLRCSALSPLVSSQRLGGGGCGLVVVQWWVGDCFWICWWWWFVAVMGFVFGFADSDGVSRSDFSLPSRPWLQTKWVVMDLGLPAWVWWLWVWVCQRGCGCGCGGYGWLLLIGLLKLWLIGYRGFG